METFFPESRKKNLSTWSHNFQIKDVPFEFSVSLHGLPLHFKFTEESLISELKQFFPKTWQQKHPHPISIHWKSPDPEELKNQTWEHIEDPNCHFLDNFISQRDFLAKRVSPLEYELMTEQKMDDGIFNFLRYLMPLELLQKNQILFHSSCVIDASEKAYLFFGPSGAGKTTISSLCQDAGGVVLGDDMNILSTSSNQLLVEGAAFGQRIYASHLFGQKFPVEKVFWLQKGLENRARPLAQGSLSFWLSSFANFFWDQLSREAYTNIFGLLSTVNAQQTLYELEFNKNSEVWNYVRDFK